VALVGGQVVTDRSKALELSHYLPIYVSIYEWIYGGKLFVCYMTNEWNVDGSRYQDRSSITKRPEHAAIDRKAGRLLLLRGRRLRRQLLHGRRIRHHRSGQRIATANPVAVSHETPAIAAHLTVFPFLVRLLNYTRYD